MITLDPRIDEKFLTYPADTQEKMHRLRRLVHECAKELHLDKLEETLKWGEPSFVTKHGSTLRMDWKEKNPDQYALYFKCTSRLVETFKLVFGDTFTYEGTRAIVFGKEEEVPVEEVKKCIKATLQYHKVKQDKTLGI